MTENGSPVRVLLVEDNPGDARLVTERLSEVRATFEVTRASNLAEAIGELRNHEFALIILDLGLPDSQGIPTLKRVREVAPTTPVVVVSGLADTDVALEAVAAGAQDYLSKDDLTGPRLGSMIRFALERQRIARKVDATRRALAESEARFRRLVETAPHAMLLLDHQGRLLLANDMARAVFGGLGDDRLGNSAELLIRESDRPDFLELLRAALAETPGATLQDETLEGLRADGTSFAALVNLVRLDFADHPTVSMTVEDISHRLTAQQAIERISNEYETLLDTAADGIVGVDEGGLCTFVNRTATNLTGLEAKEILGQSFSGLVLLVDDPVERALATGKTVESSSAIIRTAEGGDLWVDISVTPIRSGSTVQGAVILFRDITARLQAERELREVFGAIDQSPIGVIMARPDGTIHYANDAFTSLCGFSEEEVLGKTPGILKSPDTPPEVHEELWQTILSGRTWKGELKNRRKDGSEYWAYVVISPVMDDSGELNHFIGFQNNISERRELAEKLDQERDSLARRVEERTEELQSANERLEQAMRAKDYFLAAMSHELRTPLNSVLTLTESLSEGVYGEVRPEQHGPLKTVHDSGAHLLSLINDILDLSKIGAGKMELQKAAVDLQELAEQAVRLVAESADHRGLRLHSRIEGSVRTVDADPRRLKQIVLNLLGNAVKFTDEGTVALVISSTPGEGEVRISVEDTGIGLSEAQIERLFHPFEQLDVGLDRRFEGTGLGLALVKEMTELHGGRVSAESEGIGHGSRFTIHLPATSQLQEPTTLEEPVEPEVAAGPLQEHPLVLIADDNPQGLNGFKRFLEARGFEVVTARSGGDALRALEALQRFEARTPDVILMDVQMPGMSGLEATEKLRSMPGGESAFVIALTALAMSGDRERCLGAGMDEYLSKPVSLKELEAAIRKGIGQGRKRSGTTEHEKQATRGD